MNVWFLVILIASAVVLLAIVAVSVYLCWNRGMCQCRRKQQTLHDSQDDQTDEQSSEKLESTEDEGDHEHEVEKTSGSAIPSVSERSTLLALGISERSLRKQPSMSSVSTITSSRRKSLKLDDACGIIRFRLEFSKEQKQIILCICYIYLGPIEPPSYSTLYSVSATLLPKKKQRFETKARPFAPAEEENYIVSSFKRHLMTFKKIDDVRSLYRQALRLRVGEHRIGSETVIAEAMIHLADLVQTDPVFMLDGWRPLHKITPFQKLDVRNLAQHASLLQQNLRRSKSTNIDEETQGSEVSVTEEVSQETTSLNTDPGVQSPDDGSASAESEHDSTTADPADDVQSSRANLLS